MFNKWFNNEVFQLPSCSTNLKTNNLLKITSTIKTIIHAIKRNLTDKKNSNPMKLKHPIPESCVHLSPTNKPASLPFFMLHHSQYTHGNARVMWIITPIESDKAQKWRNSAARHTGEINIMLPTERNLISPSWSLARLSLWLFKHGKRQLVHWVGVLYPTFRIC